MKYIFNLNSTFVFSRFPNTNGKTDFYKESFPRTEEVLENEYSLRAWCLNERMVWNCSSSRVKADHAWTVDKDKFFNQIRQNENKIKVFLKILLIKILFLLLRFLFVNLIFKAPELRYVVSYAWVRQCAQDFVELYF